MWEQLSFKFMDTDARVRGEEGSTPVNKIILGTDKTDEEKPTPPDAD